jgi:hypothetical protein
MLWYHFMVLKKLFSLICALLLFRIAFVNSALAASVCANPSDVVLLAGKSMLCSSSGMPGSDFVASFAAFRAAFLAAFLDNEPRRSISKTYGLVMNNYLSLPPRQAFHLSSLREWSTARPGKQNLPMPTALRGP